MISTCPKFSTTTYLTSKRLPKRRGSMTQLLHQLCTNRGSRIHISYLLHIWHTCNHVRHVGLCLIVKKSLAFASKHRQVIECSTTNSEKQIQREIEWKRDLTKNWKHIIAQLNYTSCIYIHWFSIHLIISRKS